MTLQERFDYIKEEKYFLIEDINETIKELEQELDNIYEQCRQHNKLLDTDKWSVELDNDLTERKLEIYELLRMMEMMKNEL